MNEFDPTIAGLADIPGSALWKRVEPVTKGWSSDLKYRIETKSGQELLLRIAAASAVEEKRKEYEVLQQVDSLSIPMTRPVAFGSCNQGGSIFTLLTWLPGRDVEMELSRLSQIDQYILGEKAGRLLQRIHTLPAPSGIRSWADRFSAKIVRKLRLAHECEVSTPGLKQAEEFIRSRIGLLVNRPQCLQHGDFHCGNLIATPHGEIGVIDFNRVDYGDPWEEFNRIVWCVPVSAAFASGRIDGYFEGNPPEEFFNLLALYIAVNMVASIPWAIPYGKEQVDVMAKQAEDILGWYDGFRLQQPNWYHRPIIGS